MRQTRIALRVGRSGTQPAIVPPALCRGRLYRAGQHGRRRLESSREICGGPTALAGGQSRRVPRGRANRHAPCVGAAMTLDIIVHRIYFFFESGVIFYVFVINTIYFFLTAIAFFTMRRHHAPLNEAECTALAESPLVPAISLIVPAYNEAMSVEESVGGMLHLRYPWYEVIVVNDGSTDATLQKLTDKFRLYKSARAAEGTLETKPIRHIYESRDPIPLVGIDKENGGKVHSANTGLKRGRIPRSLGGGGSFSYAPAPPVN